MICTKCHQNEATIHLTTVVGPETETVDLCKDCAPLGFADLDLEKAEAMSVIGKKCEFCGGNACSGEMLPGGAGVYWCLDCGTELMSIVTGLLQTERPDLMRRLEAVSFLSICADSDLQAWSEAANRKSVQILKERRRQDGRDQHS
jgi:hypothetical protein